LCAAIAGGDKTSEIVVLGGAASTLPGRDGAELAFPARLEAALHLRLPGIRAGVAAELRLRPFADEMADAIDKLLADERPDLVIWQAGTYGQRPGGGSGRQFSTAWKSCRLVARTSS
jgi:hypothetical protein